MSECELLLLSYDVHVGRAIATLIMSRIDATPAAAANKPVTQCPIERMEEHPSCNYLLLLLLLRHWQHPAYNGRQRAELSHFPPLPNDAMTTETDVNTTKKQNRWNRMLLFSLAFALLSHIIFFPIYLLQMWHRQYASFSFVYDVCWWDLLLSYFFFISLFPVPTYGMESNDLFFTRSIYR